MEKSWKYWGKLKNEEMVFVSQEGEVAVEKDYRHLVEPKPAELFEIFQRWPGLMDTLAKKKDLSPAIKPDTIEELKDTIIELEFEAAENRNMIEALKYANEEKDKMIVALTEDVQSLKSRLDALNDVTRSWREAAAEKDSQIAALRYELTSGEYSKKE